MICQWLIILLHSIGIVIIPNRNVYEQVDIPTLYGDCKKHAIIFWGPYEPTRIYSDTSGPGHKQPNRWYFVHGFSMNFLGLAGG